MNGKKHSWPKLKIILIKKKEGNSTTSHFFMIIQNSWMVVVFPIQIFWTVVIHYLKNKVGVVDFANAQGLVMF